MREPERLCVLVLGSDVVMVSERADSAGDLLGSIAVGCTSLGWSMKRQANGRRDTREATRDRSQRLRVTVEPEGCQASSAKRKRREKLSRTAEFKHYWRRQTAWKVSQTDAVLPARLAGNCRYNMPRR